MVCIQLLYQRIPVTSLIVHPVEAVFFRVHQYPVIGAVDLYRHCVSIRDVAGITLSEQLSTQYQCLWAICTHAHLQYGRTI